MSALSKVPIDKPYVSALIRVIVQFSQELKTLPTVARLDEKVEMQKNDMGMWKIVGEGGQATIYEANINSRGSLEGVVVKVHNERTSEPVNLGLFCQLIALADRRSL